MSTVVWVLTFTVLGANPEHKTYDKYRTKEECQQDFIKYKEEYKKDNKQIVGVCTRKIK